MCCSFEAPSLFFYQSDNNPPPSFSFAGTIQAFAGKSTIGDGGAATAAVINTPPGIAVASNGDVYVSEWGQRVRKITANGKGVL